MLLSVQKMTCGHCVRAVTAAIQALDPEATIEVDLAAGTVRVDGNVDANAVIRAIGEEGYPAQVAPATGQ
ncbi:MAG: cation transporter [Steroidobacteraceae bacterium]|jgi:copper chaperone|nr:cation transporter [Steroidobacteraceae bacterium]